MSHVLGFPLIASEHGLKIDYFILFLHVIMVLAFVGWGTWFVAALVRFRRKKHPRADYGGIRNRMPFLFVALMAVAEGLMLIGFALPFWHDEIVRAPSPEDKDVFEVRVIAQQFQWNVHYPGADGKFGRTSPDLVDDVLNPIGLDNDDPASEDDITTLNQLHLPVGRQVLIHLSTKDVIHSMFLPEFRIKQDAIPGMRVPVYFVPTMTTKEFRKRTGEPDRNFEIACAQLCGNSHYTMKGFVTVETQDEFNTWYDAKLEEKQAYSEDDDWWFQQ